MTPENKARHASALLSNPLLPVLMDARSDDIRQAWEGESEPEKREQLWHELKATNDLKDFIHGTISSLAGGDARQGK